MQPLSPSLYGQRISCMMRSTLAQFQGLHEERRKPPRGMRRLAVAQRVTLTSSFRYAER
jgi:hypothetical protein